MNRVSLDEYSKYNSQDCVYTREVYKRLAVMLAKQNMYPQFEFQMSLYPMIQDIMLRGFRLNGKKRSNQVYVLRSKMHALERWIRDATGIEDINLGSPKQVGEMFYGVFRQRPVYHKGKTAPSTDEEALTKIAERSPILKPIVDRLKTWRNYSVLCNTFLAISGPPNRMYCGLNICGTETFRFSSAKNPFSWGTNMQNIPRDIRSIFQPDEGYVLLDCDLERADLQVVVWEANDAVLKQMIREKVDIHAENARLLGVTRHLAKIWVHLTNYSGSARTAAVSCGLTTHQSEKMRRIWFGEHPGILEWHHRTERELRTTRTIKNIFGFRRVYFDRIDGLLPQALAWKPQSTVSIAINMGLMNVYKQYQNQHVQVLMQVHDSGILQLALPYEKSEIQSITKLMEVCIPYPDPLVIGVNAKISSHSWGECQEVSNEEVG